MSGEISKGPIHDYAGDEVVRTDTLRHRVATCPACDMGIYADVVVETKFYKAVITPGGHVGAHCKAFTGGAQVVHACDKVRRPVDLFAATPPTTRTDEESQR